MSIRGANIEVQYSVYLDTLPKQQHAPWSFSAFNVAPVSAPPIAPEPHGNCLFLGQSCGPFTAASSNNPAIELRDKQADYRSLKLVPTTNLPIAAQSTMR